MRENLIRLDDRSENFLLNILKRGMVIYMKKETEAWINIAIEDFQSANYLLEKSLYRMVCYHSQQTVERLSKAIIVQHDRDIPRTHNLLDLNKAVKELGYDSPLSDEDGVFLNGINRSLYPFEEVLLPSGDPTEKDAEKALDVAKQMITWSRDILKF